MRIAIYTRISTEEAVLEQMLGVYRDSGLIAERWNTPEGHSAGSKSTHQIWTEW